MMNSWDQIRDYLQGRLSQESYDNWFRGATFVATDGETLVVQVPDRETRALLETDYAELVAIAIRDLNLPVTRVSYDPAPVRPSIRPAADAFELESSANSLNPK